MLGAHSALRLLTKSIICICLPSFACILSSLHPYLSKTHRSWPFFGWNILLNIAFVPSPKNLKYLRPVSTRSSRLIAVRMFPGKSEWPSAWPWLCCTWIFWGCHDQHPEIKGAFTSFSIMLLVLCVLRMVNSV